MNIKKTLYIFDLDGTLVDLNTTFDFIEIEINYSSIFRKLLFNFIKKIKPFLLFLNKRIGYDFYRALVIFIAFFLKKELLGIHPFRDKLENSKIKNVYIRLQKYKKENKEVLILSATIDPLRNIIEEGFGVRCICSRLLKISKYYIGIFTLDLLLYKIRFIQKLSNKYTIVEYYTDDKKEAENVLPYVDTVYLVRKGKLIKLSR